MAVVALYRYSIMLRHSGSCLGTAQLRKAQLHEIKVHGYILA